MRKFQIVRALKPFPETVNKSIFLLGPIPRTADTKHLSWKPEAYRILEELGYDGVVYEPEHETTPDMSRAGYENWNQIDWEVEALNRADVIVAWIPRQFPEMPAMTSNFEIGEWFKSGKLLLGYPDNAPKMSYLSYRSQAWLDEACKWQVPVHHGLKMLLKQAVAWLGAGAIRRGAETAIPLGIWNDKTFQQWYCSLQLGHHELAGFKVEYAYYRKQKGDGRPKNKIWAIRPKVKVDGENRFKDNEVVIGRPATVSVLMYYPHGYQQNWKIVLVREYRPAAMNHLGWVYELPGGSIEPLYGPHDEKAILSSALREVEEEVGLTLDASRLCKCDVRQTMATLVACENHLYTYELDEAEFKSLSEATDKVRIGEDNEEITTTMIANVSSILYDDSSLPVDWVNMGMIAQFIAKIDRYYTAIV